MKKMTEHQIVSILKEVEASIPIKEFCHKYGMKIQYLINVLLPTMITNPPLPIQETQKTLIKSIPFLTVFVRKIGISVFFIFE
ncbi:hypothetical protein [Gilliamella sp. ESL0254]|uniref:hypothetical protein n=1 Tax=Gilliamella sp. ESL0254 TaxID=2705035 RepID=UPI001580096D|nr:hypothetical protein [Gilliamella sp. ESL0254]NUF27417.1 hypothetical protein [Gilliamella sp. ESL0254]